MAHRYTVIFEKEAEGGYHVFCSTLPGCHTQSETIEEGVENIREAIELCLEVEGMPDQFLEFVGIQRVTVAA